MTLPRFLIALLLAATFASCSKNKEEDDLAQAQKCLDEVKDYSQAAACMTFVKDYDSQRAQILKCSIVLTSGGLMEEKIIKAYEALKGGATNTTASFLAILALEKDDAAGGYSKAKEADIYCQATGVSGYQFLSSVVLAGSSMNAAIAEISGTGIDSTQSQTAIDAVVDSLITQCSNTASLPPECATKLATLGAAVTTVQGVYCGTNGANEDVCKQVQDAVDAAGSDPSAVGQALFCYLKNMKYQGGQCVP